jgi:hypothetical protein
MTGLNSSAGGRRRAGGCTFTAWRPNRVRCTTSAIASSTRSAGYAAAAAERRMRALSKVRGMHPSSSVSTGSSCRGGRVVAVSRERKAATCRSPVRAEPPATAASLSAAVWNTTKTGS